jgi:hypothetical protein
MKPIFWIRSSILILTYDGKPCFIPYTRSTFLSMFTSQEFLMRERVPIAYGQTFEIEDNIILVDVAVRA